MTVEENNAITTFWGDNWFLSNFYECPLVPLVLGDIAYPTLEHAYQAMKSYSQDSRKWISEATTPAEAKRRGQTVELRKDWEEIKSGVMLVLLRKKFGLGSTLSVALLRTGDAVLIEGNYWHDQYWGDCWCERHIDNPGWNILGKLLMRVRDELRAGLTADERRLLGV